MSIEIKTATVEPIRQTFSHTRRRFGDKPADVHGNEAAGVLTGDTYGVNLPGTESGFTIYSGRNAAKNVQADLKESTKIATED